ncbi:unnamed protein product, partial [marine sediment metagenome]
VYSFEKLPVRQLFGAGDLSHHRVQIHTDPGTVE